MPAEEKRTILIVDGSEEGRESLRGAFGELYNIICADSADDAVRALEERSDIDAVLLNTVDIRHSHLVIEKANDEERFRKATVIAVIAGGDGEQLEAFSLGVMDVIVRPFNADIARFRLQNAIKRERAGADQRLLSTRLVETIIRNIPGGLAEFRCEKGKPVRTYLSADAYKLLGYSQSEPPASGLEEAFSRVNPIDRAVAIEVIERAVRDVSKIDISMRINPSGMGVRWINFVGYPNRDIDGTVCFYGIYTDVTRQKAGEEAKRLSMTGLGERRRSGQPGVMRGAWRELFAKSEEMLFIKDVDLIYLAASKPFAEMVGLKDPDEVIGKSDFDLFEDKELARRYTQDDMRILHSGLDMEDFIEPIIGSSGRRRYASTSKYAVRDDDGRVVGILGRGSDITRELQNKPQTAGSYRSGRTLFRYIIKSKRMELPPKAMELYSVPASIDGGPDYFVARGLIAPRSVEAWLGFFIAIDRGERSGEAEIETVLPSGNAAWLRMQFTGVVHENGTPDFAIVSCEDITLRRDSDKSLSVEYIGFYSAMRSVYSLSVAVNLTQNSYYMLDNERFISKTPRDKGVFDELVETGLRSVPPEDRKAFSGAFSRQSLLKAFSEGKSVVALEHRQYADDGVAHWVETTVLRIDNPYDDDVLEFTLARIIDDKKADEERLRKALDITSGTLAERLRFIRLVDDIFPGLICLYHPSTGEVSSLTGNLCQLFGYTCDEIADIVRNGFADIPHPEDARDIVEAIGRVARERPESFEFEPRVHKKDGSARYVTLSGKRFLATDGSDGYICLALDGTARRALMDEMRISGEEIKLCMARMGKIIFRYDAVRKVFSLPEEFAAALGLPEECADVVKSLSLLGFKLDPAPENRAAFDAFAKALYEGEKLGSCEAAIIREGEKIWMKLEFVSIFDADGRCARAVISVEDVSVKRAYVEENRALRKRERIMQAVADSSDRVAYFYDVSARAASALDENAAIECGLPLRVFGAPEDQISRGAIAPESASAYRDIFRFISLGEEKGEIKLRARPDGKTWRWFEMRFACVGEPGKTPSGAVITLLDITQRHEQELTYARYLQNMKSSADKEVLFFETDLTRDMVEKQGGIFSPFHMMSEGLSHTDIANYIAENYFNDNERERALESFGRERLLKLFSEGITDITDDWDVVFDDGQTHWVRSNMQMVTDPYTSHVRLLTVLRDVTGEKLDELSLHRQARLDGLTGVYNRATVEFSVRESLATARECAMILIDVDDLKTINDTLGHAQGDRALKLIAGELQKCAGESGIVGRLGGDEFVAFLPEASCASANQMLSNLIKNVRNIDTGDALKAHMRCSAGAALGDGNSDTFESLYKMADAALYTVKRRGKDGFAFYGE